ncbi:MobV family relaxase [Clostridium sp. M14]|uniref:MobV family relaxase n=1 Tax=Clostridium sp. M14 TaxID=2716311 RepID=UPI0013EED79A|nr:MobV family relaxase [Clostridium sp. M14]MBZ9691657.1 plasmid recombination protein [Clostridium sp. M14]NFI56607.1 recombinase [Clostridium botulinum]
MYQKNYSIEDNKNLLEKYNKKVTGARANVYFCVFRVGKKIKDLGQVEAFQKHMEREMDVINADPRQKDKNRVLIGNNNIVENVKNHVYGIKIRSNANIATDLVLTTGNGFYNSLPPQEKEEWIHENINFLNEHFGENCLYATLHMDETTPHIHALIVPRFWDEDKKKYKLQSNKYFDGIEKMRTWQDKYSQHMNKRFNNLIRGVRGSKARHMDIKTYYSLITKKLDLIDDKQVLAYAKHSYLLEKRVKALEYTLIEIEQNEDTRDLVEKINKLDENNKVYKETIRTITKKYGLKEKDILDIVSKIENKNNKKERER